MLNAEMGTWVPYPSFHLQAFFWLLALSLHQPDVLPYWTAGLGAIEPISFEDIDVSPFTHPAYQLAYRSEFSIFD